MSEIKLPAKKQKGSKALALAALFAAFGVGFLGAKLATPPSLPSALPTAPIGVEENQANQPSLGDGNMPALDFSGEVTQVTGNGYVIKTKAGFNLEITLPESGSASVGDTISITPAE
jgi:hypothetical protein